MATGWTQDQDIEGIIGWKSFGIDGDVAYVSIRLDGYNLFVIAAERTRDDKGQWGLGNLQIRRNRIESRLKSQLKYLSDNQVQPESLLMTTTRLNQQIAVQMILQGKATITKSGAEAAIALEFGES